MRQNQAMGHACGHASKKCPKTWRVYEQMLECKQEKNKTLMLLLLLRQGEEQHAAAINDSSINSWGKKSPRSSPEDSVDTT